MSVEIHAELFLKCKAMSRMQMKECCCSKMNSVGKECIFKRRGSPRLCTSNEMFKKRINSQEFQMILSGVRYKKVSNYGGYSCLGCSFLMKEHVCLGSSMNCSGQIRRPKGKKDARYILVKDPNQEGLNEKKNHQWNRL